MIVYKVNLQNAYRLIFNTNKNNKWIKLKTLNKEQGEGILENSKTLKTLIIIMKNMINKEIKTAKNLKIYKTNFRNIV